MNQEIGGNAERAKRLREIVERVRKYNPNFLKKDMYIKNDEVPQKGLQLNDRSEIDEVELTDDSEKSKDQSFKYYTYIGNNNYLPINEIKTKNSLPSGLYNIVYNNQRNQHMFQKQSFETDKIYDLPIKELGLIANDITKFWKTEEKFKEYGLVHKRGILLYGRPGCGKSCAIQVVIKDLIDNQKGLIFKIGNSDELQTFAGVFSSLLRSIEPDRKVVVIMEDIDGLFEFNTAVQTILLNLLDGINQNSNILYIGTTNYPEKLQERILNRPSRFDRRYKFDTPNAEVREAYLVNALKENDLFKIDLDKWVEETENLTLSHLRELIVSVIILGNDFDETIETLRNMGEIISSTQDRIANVGFAKKNQTISGFANGIGDLR